MHQSVDLENGLHAREELNVFVQAVPIFHRHGDADRRRRCSGMVFGIDLEELGLVVVENVEDVHEQAIAIVALDGKIDKEFSLGNIRIPLHGDKAGSIGSLDIRAFLPMDLDALPGRDEADDLIPRNGQAAVGKIRHDCIAIGQKDGIRDVLLRLLHASRGRS